MRSILSALCVAVILAAHVPAPTSLFAQGQGNGRPKNPKADKSAPSSPTPAPVSSSGSSGSNQSGSSSPTVSAPSPTPAAPAVQSAPASPAALETTPDIQGSIASFRQFGAWLDDASAPTRGEGYTSFGAGYWRMPGVSQTNVPAFGAGIGVTDKLLVAGSVPFYQVRWEGGSARGLDDVYLSAKYNLLDPTLTLSEVGLSVGAVAEILSSGVDRRLHFALPVSVEVRRLPFRVYGSAGYFTRGSIFGAGAVEWTSPNYITLTGAVTQSYSLEGDPLLDAMAVGRQRVDMTVGVAYPLARVASVYGSYGRSLRSANQDPTQMALSGGIAFRFSAVPSRP